MTGGNMDDPCRTYGLLWELERRYSGEETLDLRRSTLLFTTCVVGTVWLYLHIGYRARNGATRIFLTSWRLSKRGFRPSLAGICIRNA